MNLPLGLPFEIGVFGRVALLLIAAIAAAQICDRWLRLPRLVGYVLAGLLLGPSMLAWVPSSITGDLRPLVLLGLGLLLFELGSRVDLRWLRHNPMLIVSSLIESGVTFVATYLFLEWFDLATATRVAVAAIAVSTSPSVVMRIVAENNARGQMTERLMLMTALNSLYAILLLKISVGVVHLDRNAGLLQAIGHPVYMAAGSLLLGAALAYGMHLARFAQLTRESERFTLVIAVVLLGTTLADRLGLSVPMALLCGGMLLRSLSQRLHLFPEHFGTAGALLVIILFTLTGVALDPRHVLAGGMMSLGLLLIRGLAKYLGAYVSAGYGGLAPKKAAWLALALLPMSSLAVLQAHEVAGLYADFGDDIVAIVLGAVLIMELLGPVATQVALRRSGEATPGSGAKEA
jgi:Kef-type K+ transport system membrane component KefB